MRNDLKLSCLPAPAWTASWPAHPHFAPRLIALLLALTGSLNLLSALTPALAPRLHLIQGLVGLDMVRCSHTASVIVGVVLLMLGRSVARRNRRAARVAFVALIVAALLNLLKGLDIEEAAGCLFAAGTIWRYRTEFVVGALPISWRGALSRTLWLAGLIVLYAQLGALLLGRNVRVELTIGSTGSPIPFPIASFLGLWTDAPTVRYLGPQGHWFRHSLHAIIALGLLCAVLRLLQPLIPAPPASPDERRRARALLARHGTDTLAYFHLRPDRRYIFAPDGAGFVSFVVRGDVALLGGDPLAAPGSLALVVRHAVEILTLQGLSLCVVGASTHSHARLSRRWPASDQDGRGGGGPPAGLQPRSTRQAGAPRRPPRRRARDRDPHGCHGRDRPRTGRTVRRRLARLAGMSRRPRAGGSR